MRKSPGNQRKLFFEHTHTYTIHNPLIHSDEQLTLKYSMFDSLQGGKFYFIKFYKKLPNTLNNESSRFVKIHFLFFGGVQTTKM